MTEMGTDDTPSTAREPVPTPEPASSAVERKPLDKATTNAIIGAVVGLLLGLIIGFAIWGSGGDSTATAPPTSTGETTVDSLLADGLALQQSGQNEPAKAKYNEALALDPSNRFALYNLGVLSQTTGNPGQSIDFYRRALATDPAFNSARYNLALALRDTGDRAGAIAEFETLLTADPDGIGTLLNFGNLLIEEGDAERGQQLIDRANELSAGTP